MLVVAFPPPPPPSQHLERSIRTKLEPPENPSEKRRVGKKAKKEKKTFQLKYVVIVSILFFII